MKPAYQGEFEFCGASEDDRNGRIVRLRLIRKPDDKGAHPFAKFTRRRGKRAGTIFNAAFHCVGKDESPYAGEVMLLAWADGPAGSTIALQIDDEKPRHPFLGFTRPSAGTAGSRFMAAFVETGDFGEPIDEERQQRMEDSRQRHLQTVSNVAAIIIKNPRFHDWLRETVEDVDWSDDRANKWLKTELEIDSKTELDDPKNEEAIAHFHRIRHRFVDWQEEQGTLERPF